MEPVRYGSFTFVLAFAIASKWSLSSDEGVKSDKIIDKEVGGKGEGGGGAYHPCDSDVLPIHRWRMQWSTYQSPHLWLCRYIQLDMDKRQLNEREGMEGREGGSTWIVDNSSFSIHSSSFMNCMYTEYLLSSEWEKGGGLTYYIP